MVHELMPSRSSIAHICFDRNQYRCSSISLATQQLCWRKRISVRKKHIVTSWWTAVWLKLEYENSTLSLALTLSVCMCFWQYTEQSSGIVGDLFLITVGRKGVTKQIKAPSTHSVVTHSFPTDVFRSLCDFKWCSTHCWSMFMISGDVFRSLLGFTSDFSRCARVPSLRRLW